MYEANHAGGTGTSIMKGRQVRNNICGYKSLEKGKPTSIWLIKTSAVLKGIFGRKKDEDGERRKLCNEEYHNLYSMHEHEMGEACVYEGNNKCIHNFGWTILSRSKEIT
jgi:hypothetical protein